jgi:hypothetical protein
MFNDELYVGLFLLSNFPLSYASIWGGGDCSEHIGFSVQAHTGLISEGSPHFPDSGWGRGGEEPGSLAGRAVGPSMWQPPHIYKYKHKYIASNLLISLPVTHNFVTPAANVCDHLPGLFHQLSKFFET